MDAGNGFAQPASLAGGTPGADGQVTRQRHRTACHTQFAPRRRPVARRGVPRTRRIGGAGSGQEHGLRGAQRRQPGTVQLQPHCPCRAACRARRASVRLGDQRHRPWRRADRCVPCLRRALRSPGARQSRSGSAPPAGDRHCRQRERSLQEGAALPIGTWAETQCLAGAAVWRKRPKVLSH